MALFDIRSDAARAFATLRTGGIAIVPNDVGYSVLGGSRTALERIFITKRRPPEKLNAMIANMPIYRELHACSSRGREIVDAIVGDYDLPLGCIAPYRPDHPMLRGLDVKTLAASSLGGTLVMLLNAGRFHAALTALSAELCFPLVGSSANLTRTGTKFCVEDIDQEIKAIADVIIDYGMQRFHRYAASSTLLNVETLDVVRVGSCFEDISYVVRRHFGITLQTPSQN